MGYQTQPFISVIVPIRNEERTIARCLQAIIEQDYPADRLEVLVVDGMSTDRTREIVAQFAADHPNIQLLDNPRRIVSTALNIGLARAKGEVIVRVDGHTVIEPDYVRQCVRYLAETNADNVGGPMRPTSESYLGKAIGLATSSPFGVGGSKFHYSQEEQFVDTVYLGAYRRDVFDRIGGFDEELVRNQDYEFNYRLRAAGGRIFFTPAIKSWYYGRESLWSLWKQYFQYGGWKTQVIFKEPASTRLRHLVAPAFVAVLLASAALSRTYPAFAILSWAMVGSYALAALAFSAALAAQHGWWYLPALPLAFASLHLSWGLGFWWGAILAGLPRFQLHAADRKKVLVMGDLLAVNAAVLAALWRWTTRRDYLHFDLPFILDHIAWFPFLTVLWLALATANNFYDLQVTARFRTGLARLAGITAQLLLAYFLIYFFSPPGSLPRLFVLEYGVLSSLLILLWRALRPFLLVWPKFRRRAIVVGAGRRGQAIAQAIQANLDADYELVGFIDDSPSVQGQTIAGVSVVGRGSDLVSRAIEAGASEIILATDRKPQGELREALMDCHGRGLAITPMPLLYGQITGRIPVEHLDDWLDVVPLQLGSIFNIYPWMKRLIDVAVAALGLAVLAPLFPLLALAIYLDAPGPILESEERVGRAGRPFRLLRFRSTKGDGRIPRVGRWLRRTGLGGWPQLINVCKGEVSLVGPRPERPELVARLEKEIPFYRLRQSARPGLLGWAQVHGLGGPPPEEARVELEYDLYYLRHQSLALDLTILLRSIARR